MSFSLKFLCFILYPFPSSLSLIVSYILPTNVPPVEANSEINNGANAKHPTSFFLCSLVELLPYFCATFFRNL